ncbi:MAG: isoprenylcysteine carboxylmethyltransferase family protein [bacterium]|nr:isoprenylcysteine carboxylmethyltransferase family protein [bacterium]
MKKFNIMCYITKLIGKTPIPPFYFYSGKVSGYMTWALFALSVSGIFTISRLPAGLPRLLSYILFVTGLLVIIISSFNLGGSTRLGLPAEKTAFRSDGLYRFSRNPMYIGFGLLTVSSVIYHGNLFIAIPGMYSIIIYHYIILGEEKFLKQRFGKKYMAYKKKVRRYI